MNSTLMLHKEIFVNVLKGKHNHFISGENRTLYFRKELNLCFWPYTTLHSDPLPVSFFPFDLLSLIAHGLLLSHASNEQITPSIFSLSDPSQWKGKKEKTVGSDGVVGRRGKLFRTLLALWRLVAGNPPHPICPNPIDIKWQQKRST